MKYLPKKGFTLIEIMVVVSISSLISLVVLWSYGKFNDNIALTAAGQELLIAFREAQVYSLTVREADMESGNFNYAYGVYVEPDDPTHYYLFVDRDASKTYDVGNGCGTANTECLEQGTFRNRIVVSSICNQSSCPPHPSVNKLDVTFLRPNPDANINFTNNGGIIWSTSQSVGKIVLQSPMGKNLTVVVSSSGQISTE